ncbi:MAG: hypothetical protein QOG63_168 [Thermoleophilaceae bacterium]|nr:hypothetical protein [Thermoleophilaceae bacterium]
MAAVPRGVSAAVLLLLAAPAPALAASLRVQGAKGGAPLSLLYSAAPREVNDLSMRIEPSGAVVVTDAGASIRASRSCKALEGGGYRCATAGTGGFVAITARLGDGADRARIDTGNGPSGFVIVDAGIGDDDVQVDGPAFTSLFGGDGSDRLVGGGGADLLDGGSDNQSDVLDGRGGIDVVSYSTHFRGVAVDLAAGRGGVDGENDVLAGIEGILGSRFADSLSGDEGPNTLAGGPGDDALLGAGGDDALIGGAGADQLFGGDGGDVISSSEAPARNRADVVGCGPGADLVRTVETRRGPASTRDLITTDCEQVDPGLLGRRIGVPPRPLEDGVIQLGVPCPRGARGACAGKLIATADGEVLARGRARLRRGSVSAIRARLTAAGRRVARNGGALPVRFRVSVAFARHGSGRIVHARATVLLLVPVS